LSWLVFQTCCPRRPRRSVERMLAVVQPAPSGLHPAKRGSACFRFAKYRGSLYVVHFRYGPSVHLPQHPTPPRGDAVEVVFRREQPNSAGGTRTHVQASFPGATPACSRVSWAPPPYYPGIAPVALRYQKGVPLPKNLGLPESCRRFSLSHSEGEKAGVKGPSWGL